MSYATPRGIRRANLPRYYSGGRFRREGDSAYDEKPKPVRVPEQRQIAVATGGIFSHKQTVG